ncbi:MAG TPA: glycosyltransferase family 4 protein [Ramlibacter sp.]|jgi:glycosyltransferase involved in cell wall biosynthesis|uniref:glycosyltransferase family 4 protein n=1 Tax=Ramlibacter sp. TaxID=1917967 RepID=UPI002D689804|nr:glycosyltransferase family 4 protein [Ramlibacter sp.]HZY18406.1 glycosyltransferase family 4 protein [Ramlibacter sp.]
MKLMVLSTLYAPHQVGGAEKIAQILSEELSTRGHECVVVTTRRDPGTRSTVRNGVRIHRIGLRNVYWPYGGERISPWLKPAWHLVNRYNPAMGEEVGRLLDRERPDLVHTHALTGFSPSAWASAHARGIPVVHTLHDYSLACPKASMFRAGANCERQCGGCRVLTQPARDHSQSVQAVVGVSRFTLQRHLDLGYFTGASIRQVIHNGLPGEVRPPPRERAPGPRLRLGYVGRLVQPKGVESLLRVMQALDPQACELVVAGRAGPGDERRLRQLAPAHVTFAGFIDPDELYRRIDLLVVPSLWEDPLPTTAIEAMRRGVPAIVSDRGGLPDIVLDGQTGRVYRAGDPSGLRRAIQEFVDRPALAAAMAPQALARAPYFGVERMAREYEDVLATIAAAAPPSAARNALLRAQPGPLQRAEGSADRQPERGGEEGLLQHGDGMAVPVADHQERDRHPRHARR